MPCQLQLFIAYGVAKDLTFGVFDDEVTGSTSTVYVGRKEVVMNGVEQPEAVYLTRRLVVLPATALQKV